MSATDEQEEPDAFATLQQQMAEFVLEFIAREVAAGRQTGLDKAFKESIDAQIKSSMTASLKGVTWPDAQAVADAVIAKLPKTPGPKDPPKSEVPDPPLPSIPPDEPVTAEAPLDPKPPIEREPPGEDATSRWARTVPVKQFLLFILIALPLALLLGGAALYFSQNSAGQERELALGNEARKAVSDADLKICQARWNIDAEIARIRASEGFKVGCAATNKYRDTNELCRVEQNLAKVRPNASTDCGPAPTRRGSGG